MGVVKWKKFSDEQLREILDNNSTFKGVLESLGYNTGRQNNHIVKDIAEYLNYNLLSYHGRKTKEDLVGLTYGDLTIIDIDNEKSEINKRTWVKAQCSCGKIISVSYNHLQKDNTKTCGHSNLLRENIIGNKYGKWKVIKYSGNKGGHPYYLCKCECGTEKEINRDYLLNGISQSCGCYKGSFGELSIEKILIDNNVNFCKQFSFSDLKGDSKILRFDFGIFNDKNELKYLIEYNGIQHYEPVDYFGGEEQLKKQQEYDSKKKEYCNSKGIPLIIIRYDQNITDEMVVRKEYLC